MRQRFAVFAALLASAAVLGPSPGAAGDRTEAEILTSDLPGRTWVAASAALDSDGGPRPALVPLIGEHLDRSGAHRRSLTDSEQAAMSRGTLEVDALPCANNDILIDCAWEALHPSPTGLATYARESLLLEIYESEPGFIGEVPQTLLRGRVVRALHSESGIVEGDEVLVVYRHAKFLVGTTLWCNTDLRYNLRPTPGDRLLLFNRAPAEYFEPGRLRVFLPFAHEVVLGTRSGRIVWPGELWRRAGADVARFDTFDELVAFAMQRAGGGWGD